MGIKSSQQLPGEILSSVELPAEKKRSRKLDIFLYVSLLFYILSTITRIILVFLIASVSFFLWVIFINKSKI